MLYILTIMVFLLSNGVHASDSDVPEFVALSEANVCEMRKKVEVEDEFGGNIFNYTLNKVEAQGNWDLDISETEAASYRIERERVGLAQCMYAVTDTCLKCVARGNSSAQFNLAEKYREGNGVIENDAKALDLLEKSAQQGNGDAQASLANMYHSGEGVAKNNIKAYIWASMAKRKSKNTPMYSIKSELSLRQLNKAQELAAECYESDYRDCNPWFAW
jgi:TPR repeat protein